MDILINQTISAALPTFSRGGTDMKQSRRKAWTGIAAMCLLIGAVTCAFLWYGTVSSATENDTKTHMKMEGIRLSLANLAEAQSQADRDFVQQLKDNLGLLSLPLRSIVARDGDAAIQNYTYGCVLRRDGENLILPEDTTAIPLLEPQEYEGRMPYTPEECQPFRDQEGAFWSRLPDPDESSAEETAAEESDYVLCAYRQITDSYYYLYYTPLSSVETFYQTRFDTSGSIAGIETIYDGYFAAWAEEEGKYSLFCASGIFEGRAQPEELGISIGKGKSEFRPTVIDDTRYMYALSAPMRISALEQNIRIAYIVPYESYYGTTYGDSFLLLGISLAFFLVLTVWVLAARRLMSASAVTQTQRRHYGPRRMRRVAASIGAIGFAVILLTGMYAQSLSDIYHNTTTCQSALDTLFTMAVENDSHEERLKQQRSNQYLSYATRIAVLLGLYPELKTEEQLAEMSQTIRADYLMLFDSSGSEIMSNSRYVNLTYGAGGSKTSDFRRLISGVPSIVHDVRVDEVTGLNRQLIGVSMDDGDLSDGYSSLVVAVEPMAADLNSLSMGDLMRSLTTADGVIFAVDKSSKTITSASDPALAGKNAEELGMNESILREGFMDFFSLDGQDRYGCSIEQGGSLYYAAVKPGSMLGRFFVSSLIPSLIFLAAYALLSAALLAGYTEKNIDASGIRVVDDHDWAFRESEQKENERKRGWWARKTPERKAGFVLMVLLTAGIAGMIAVYATGGMNSGNMAIIPYVLSGAWTRGFNLFALTRIIILAGSVTLILLGMRALLSLLCSVMETRGETVCRLTFSLLSYLIIIAGLFYSLEALGFDTATLLASLGIFSLAISLGAKDLVADVLSGIMIVFSGEYQIGDIVEIAGFRGRVWGIGVRSTTIVNRDGNMKNISNRNVSNVMNLSRLNSRYNLQISIPYDQPLDKVKEMLDRELPAIGRGIDAIAKGPIFLGVTQMEGGYVTLGFYAECAEEDMDQVCDRMIFAIKALFDKHKIPIK